MILRIVFKSLLKSPWTTLALLASLVIGTTMAAGLQAVALEAGDRVARELRSYGANLEAVPADARGTIAESDLAAVSTIFWRYNIVAVAPWLQRQGSVQGRPAVIAGTWYRPPPDRVPAGLNVGLAAIAPDSRVSGRWFEPAKAEAVAGRRLAQRLRLTVGQTVVLGASVQPGATREGVRLSRQPSSPASTRTASVKIVGILDTGGSADEWLIMPLDGAQRLFGARGRLDRVQVSAVTVPLDDFGRRDPKTMTRREFDRWYCTAYVTSVGTQIQEALKGSVVHPVWRVVDAEGPILERVTFLIWALVAAALAAAALAVAATMTVAALRRRREIGLMKALGARDAQVAVMVLGEAVCLGLFAGVLGYGCGSLLARTLGIVIFGRPFTSPVVLAALALTISPLIAVVGSILPIRQAISSDPADVMKGAL